jgi:hypothetical protein
MPIHWNCATGIIGGRICGCEVVPIGRDDVASVFGFRNIDVGHAFNRFNVSVEDFQCSQSILRSE